MLLHLTSTINIAISLTLAVCVGYTAGKLSAHLEQQHKETPIVVSTEKLPSEPVIVIDSITDGVLRGEVNNQNIHIYVDNQIAVLDENLHFALDISPIQNIVEIAIPDNMNFVASKNGSKVYDVMSSSGNKIKPENRVYFRTIEEAIAAGYRE